MAGDVGTGIKFGESHTGQALDEATAARNSVLAENGVTFGAERTLLEMGFAPFTRRRFESYFSRVSPYLISRASGRDGGIRTRDTEPPKFRL